MSAAIERVPPGRHARGWRVVLDATILATWALMLVGALTRASMAGIACPDWPLCHGYVVPPLDGAAYPGGYRVQDVYLEFSHRVLAAVTSVGALAVAARAWRHRWRGSSLALLGLLAAQVAMGAVTVWLGNAPYTVVLHLALALGFLTVLLVLRRGAPFGARASPGGGRGWRLASGATALLTALQLLVGAAVSSQLFGLACPDYPACEPGRLWPRALDAALAWQLAHRGLAVLLVLALVGMAIAGFARSAAARDRRLAAALAAGVVAQALLGGVTVWLRIPPWASALHLGVAVVLFAALAWRAIEAGGAAATAGRVRP